MPDRLKSLPCELAQKKFKAGEFTEAIAELKAATAIDSDDGNVWQLLGIGLWEIGSVTESVSALETAMSLVPLSPEAQLALGLGYEVIKKPSLAMEIFVYLANSDNLAISLLEPLARGLGRADQLELALSVCERASEADPSAIGPLLGIVFYMGQIKRPVEEKLPVLFRALGLSPEDFSIRILAARCLHECGKSYEAAEMLRVANYDNSSCRSCLQAMYDIFAMINDEEGMSRIMVAFERISGPDGY